MRVQIPFPPPGPNQSFLSRLAEEIRRMARHTVSTEEAVPSFMLVSAGGKIYRVTVDETGTLTTTYVSG